MKTLRAAPTRRRPITLTFTTGQHSYVVEAADPLAPPQRPEFVFRVEQKLRDSAITTDALFFNLIDNAYAQSHEELACDD